MSLISPFRAERAAARRIAGDIPFLEIFIDTPLAVCEARDPKGLYDRARAGAIPDFTGISAPYEAPEAPDLTITTQGCSVEDSAEALIPALPAPQRPGVRRRAPLTRRRTGSRPRWPEAPAPAG